MLQQGVIKPDQQIKRRGKHGLVKLGNAATLKQWFDENKGKYKQVNLVPTTTCVQFMIFQIGKTNGRLSNFIVEPMVAHKPEEELYVAIYSKMDHDVVLFFEQGGVEVGDIDAKAHEVVIPVQTTDAKMCLTKEAAASLVKNVDAKIRAMVAGFIVELYEVYKLNHFTYLEINPLVVTNGQIYILDLAAKLDETAAFLCSEVSLKTN